MTSPAQDIFDERVLKRFGIAPEHLPPTSVIINRPDSAWVRYRGQILGMSGFLILEALLIAALIRVIRQRNRGLAALTEERALLEERVRLGTAEANRAREAAERLAENLTASEARLRGIFELPLVGIAITAPDKGWLEVNPRLCTLLGYSAGELAGMTWADLTYPDDLAADVAQFERILAGEIDCYSLEKRFVCQNREILWTSLSVGCVRHPDHTLKYTIALLQDITARKEAEAGLQASREQLRFVTNHAPVLIAQCDADRRYRFVNDGYAARFGMTPEQVVGRHPRDLMGEAVYAGAAPRMDAVLAGEPQDFDLDLPGSAVPRTLHASYAPQRDAAGRVTGFIAAILDITQRELAEKRFRAFFNMPMVGAALTTPEGDWLEVNDHFCAIIGYDRGELASIAWRDFTHPDDLALEWPLYQALLRGERDTIQMEKRYRHKDGRLVNVHVVGHCVRHRDGTPNYTMALVRDITEQKRTESALVIAKEQAEAANRAKSTFLANMSHEIRTPLNAVLGFTQILARDQGLTPGQRDSLTAIKRGGEHLLSLINAILDLAKIESGRLVCQHAPFDPLGLLTQVVDSFRPQAQAQGLDLTLEATSLPPWVTGDELKLRQVLINLMGNALKFTPVGRVTLGAEASTPLDIRFSVTDTGLGIAVDELPQLFQPFAQTASGRSVQQGTGLGLALSHELVRIMGGELIVASNPGQGSCFAFTLPLRAVATTPPPDDSPAPSVIGLEAGQPGCRVLIVDDQADNRAPLRALLEGLNPQPPVLACREAVDGQEAVAIWEQWQPQVVFMDMRMPILSGEEATRRIKGLMASRPEAVRTLVVALTANALNEQRDAILACGCDAFVRKPFQAEEVFAILERQAGLRFLRASAASVQSPTLTPTAYAQRLAARPPAWRAALQGAVALGDFERINALVAQLRETDPALHAALAQSAYNYDLEVFMALFAQ